MFTVLAVVSVWASGYVDQAHVAATLLATVKWHLEFRVSMCILGREAAIERTGCSCDVNPPHPKLAWHRLQRTVNLTTFLIYVRSRLASTLETTTPLAVATS